MKPIGIYVHIPFCKQKCLYCDFASYSDKEKWVEEYIYCVKEEIKKAGKENKIRANYGIEEEYIVHTIYIGGGTPSYVDVKYVEEIMQIIKENYKVETDVEITIEINPGTSNHAKLQTYRRCGINRISIGLQVIQNELLKKIGRIHTYQEFEDTYQEARNVEFGNINVDLMIALPNQTFQQVKESIDVILKLKPEHISVYSLILEEGTVLYQLVQDGKMELPKDEIEREMYWYVKRVLEQNEYIHYEISNFSKTGKESKHNCDCWDQREYLGFGVAAHSYMDKTRYSNIESIEEYVSNWKKKEESHNLILQEIQTEDSMKKEFMMLGLRKIKGVSIQRFKEKFGENPIMIYQNELSDLFQKGLIVLDGDFIKLTSEGIDVANLVWEKFV